MLSIRASKPLIGCVETGLTTKDQGKRCGVHTPRGRGRKERGVHVNITKEKGAGEDGVRLRLSLIHLVGRC